MHTTSVMYLCYQHCSYATVVMLYLILVLSLPVVATSSASAVQPLVNRTAQKNQVIWRARICDAWQGPLETIDCDLLNLRPCPIYIQVPRYEPNLDIQLTIFAPAVRIYVLNAYPPPTPHPVLGDYISSARFIYPAPDLYI